MELEGRLTPEIVEAYLQRLLWEKDVVNSEGLAIEIFRLKVVPDSEQKPILRM